MEKINIYISNPGNIACLASPMLNSPLIAKIVKSSSINYFHQRTDVIIFADINFELRFSIFYVLLSSSHRLHNSLFVIKESFHYVLFPKLFDRIIILVILILLGKLQQVTAVFILLYFIFFLHRVYTDGCFKRTGLARRRITTAHYDDDFQDLLVDIAKSETEAFQFIKDYRYMPYHTVDSEITILLSVLRERVQIRNLLRKGIFAG